MTDLVLRAALALSAAAGLYCAGSFGADWLRVGRGGTPAEATCRDGSCVLLSRTPQYALYGKIPNWAFGIPFYLLVLATSALPSAPLVAVAAVAALLAAGTSAYLVYQLYVVLKVACPLCYAAHAANFVILIMLALGACTA